MAEQKSFLNRHKALKRFVRNPLSVAGLVLVMTITACAIAAPPAGTGGSVKAAPDG